MRTMKFRRQAKLLEIIERENIETQEELSQRLKDFGYSNTQATISRDIKDLRLVKVLTGEGTYKYALPRNESDGSFSSRLRTIFRESVTSFENAQNIVVVKTLPGMANAAGSAVDAMHHGDIVGSLAGDDTLLIILKDSDKALWFCQHIHGLLD